MKKKKVFGIPSVDLPDLHIVVISIIFILIFPVAAIVASKMVDKNTPPVIIETTVKSETPPSAEQQIVSECSVTAD